jgi:hypothetical protein
LHLIIIPSEILTDMMISVHTAMRSSAGKEETNIVKINIQVRAMEIRTEVHDCSGLVRGRDVVYWDLNGLAAGSFILEQVAIDINESGTTQSSVDRSLTASPSRHA